MFIGLQGVGRILGLVVVWAGLLDAAGGDRGRGQGGLVGLLDVDGGTGRLGGG